MSFWDDIKKGFNATLDPGGIVSDVWHGGTGTPSADEKRNQQRMINEQINAYKEQTELGRQELAARKSEADAQKRRIQEKQIRALRRSYRPQGFLGGDVSTSEEGMNTKLGG